MKIDGRSLNHEALEHIRKVAVARVKAGERPGAISTSYGFARTTIYKWLRAEAQGGEEALRARKATGRPRKLTVRQMSGAKLDQRQGPAPARIRLRFVDARHRCRAHRGRLGVRLSIISTGRLLAKLGITPQKPLRRAYERDPEAIRKWEREDYPALRTRARHRGQ